MDHEAKSRAQRLATRKATQDENLFGRLQAAATASRSQAQRLLLSAGGLSITQWRILWDLKEAGPLSVQDMASIQRTDHSLVSRALPTMREKGYVEIVPNTEDKRQSLIKMTAEGARAFAIAAPVMKRRRDSLSESFAADELTTFLRLIARFEAHLNQPIEEAQ